MAGIGVSNLFSRMRECPDVIALPRVAVSAHRSQPGFREAGSISGKLAQAHRRFCADLQAVVRKNAVFRAFLRDLHRGGIVQ